MNGKVEVEKAQFSIIRDRYGQTREKTPQLSILYNNGKKKSRPRQITANGPS